MRGLSLFLLLFSGAVVASEADIVRADCQGSVEAVLPDSTRVDCLTADVAWEYEFGPKWYEGIGQALHYAMWTGRQGGLVLITNPGSRFEVRARHLIQHYNLPIQLKVLPDAR